MKRNKEKTELGITLIALLSTWVLDTQTNLPVFSD